MIFALAGNQNCGKTTLFNELTGSNQHVGNFPGVTVEQKSGVIRAYDLPRSIPGHGHQNHQHNSHHRRNEPYGEENKVVVVDLPGIYSLRPYSSEEIVTRDFLINGNPDAIINIIDASNIERNLYLTLQLIELNIPMVLALNMMDEVSGSGGTIDVNRLSEELGIPAVPISAVKKDGIPELVERAIHTTLNDTRPARLDFCSGALHRCIHAVTHLIEDHAQVLGVPARFAATKLVEGDELMAKSLGLNENEIETVEHTVKEMEAELGTDRNAALADMRYSFIERLCANTVVKATENKEHTRSIKIDNLLTNKYLALPIFLVIMLMIFWLTFNVIGASLSDLLTVGIDFITELADSGLSALGINPVIHSMIIDGAFTGVGSVLSFLPIIVTLFFFLSILEDSGYMARVAFVMDKLLRKIGLSGRSFVPMLMGFGCTVPAVMAARTLPSERDRKITILLTPFMSCSAKLPIYALFTAAFFAKNQALVMIGIYLFGMFMAILTGLAIKKFAYHGNPVPFVMELPNYRFPSARSVLLLMWDKAKDFLTRAFTIIFVSTMIIWFLQTFNYQLNVVADSADSLLASLGRAIAPIFAPLGFTDWRIPTALVTGFTAKEAVVSTMAVLADSSIANLGEALGLYFTPLTALSFLVFSLLYTPCFAAVAAINREMRASLKTICGIVLFQCGLAWCAAFLVNQIGRILGF